jgi:hypothetical protein
MNYVLVDMKLRQLLNEIIPWLYLTIVGTIGLGMMAFGFILVLTGKVGVIEVIAALILWAGGLLLFLVTLAMVVDEDTKIIKLK